MFQATLFWAAFAAVCWTSAYLFQASTFTMALWWLGAANWVGCVGSFLIGLVEMIRTNRERSIRSKYHA